MRSKASRGSGHPVLSLQPCPCPPSPLGSLSCQHGRRQRAWVKRGSPLAGCNPRQVSSPFRASGCSSLKVSRTAKHGKTSGSSAVIIILVGVNIVAILGPQSSFIREVFPPRPPARSFFSVLVTCPRPLQTNLQPFPPASAPGGDASRPVNMVPRFSGFQLVSPMQRLGRRLERKRKVRMEYLFSTIPPTAALSLVQVAVPSQRPLLHQSKAAPHSSPRSLLVPPPSFGPWHGDSAAASHPGFPRSLLWVPTYYN